MTAAPSRTTDVGPNDRTTLGKLVHLLGFLTGFVAPAIVYSVTEDRFTRANARNALNWQLFVLGVVFALALSVFALDLVSSWLLAATLVVIAPLTVNLVLCLWATRKAFRGDTWTYPIAPELI